MNKLIFNNLNVGYSNKSIIENINLEVDKGKFIAILGENGAGKSTLLHSILGIINSLKGEILLDKKNIKSIQSTDLALEIAAVFSKLESVPQVKVKDLIQIGNVRNFTPEKTSESQLLSLCKTIGIENLLSKFANELSEGQLQLVMIARALHQNTAFVLMDEPTANLDLGNQYSIFELIKNLKNLTAKTFLMATHEVDLALQFADEIWWIESGKLHAGIPEEIAFEHQIMKKISNHILHFDDIQDQFTVTQNFTKSISVEGNNELSYWVKKALNRKGYKIDNQNNKKITITQNKIEYQTNSFNSIQSFLEYIEHHD